MLKRKLKLANRFKEISLALSSLGIFNIYEYFKALFGLETEEDLKPQKIRETLEYLGPSFIKLGQILSIRPDIVPQSIIRELIKLQDKASQIDFQIIKQILEKEYAPKKLEDIFSYIEETPLASASISQVHIGILKSGEKVAIKVKRPNLEELISLDADLFLNIISFLEKHSKIIKELDIKGVIYQYKYTTLREADFEIEAQNIEFFRKAFKDNQNIKIPKCYKEISTKNVLVMEFLEGKKISDLDDKFDKKRLAEIITDAYYKMVFDIGVYHADPHPGNLLVLKDGRVGILDFGMIGKLTGAKKRLLYEHIFAVVNLDTTLAMNFYEGMKMITPKTDIDNLEYQVSIFIDKYHNKTLANINLKEMVLEIIELVRENHLKLPTDLAYLGKAAIGLDGVIRVLDETFNPTERLTQFLQKSLTDYAKEKLNEIKDIISFYYNLSFKIDEILKILRRERITFQILFKDYEEIRDLFISQINKLSLAIITAGFFISSALFNISNQHSLSNFTLYFGFFILIILIYKILKE